MAERRESTGKQLILTPTQEGAAYAVLHSLKTSPKSTMVIALSGLSGIGKTSILDSIQDGISLNNGVVARNRYEISGLSQKGKGVVISTTPREQISLEIDLAKDHVSSQTHILKGMNEEEARTFVGSLKTEHAQLSLEQIARYSLGIPLLAQQLARPGVTAEIAPRLVAGYLAVNLPHAFTGEEAARAAAPYLQLAIPEDVLSKVENAALRLFSKSIYDGIYPVVNEQAKLRNKGIEEEDPFFVAPESEGMYNDMLKTERYPNIDIFVPNLSEEELQSIQRSFGYDPKIGDEYEFDDAPRAKMFNPFYYRKVSFWHRDTAGEEHATEREFARIERTAASFSRAYQKGQLEIPVNPENHASFYVNAHAHENEKNPAIVGWMVESLLQRKGIAYFVNNRMLESSYRYDPRDQHIHALPKELELDW